MINIKRLLWSIDVCLLHSPLNLLSARRVLTKPDFAYPNSHFDVKWNNQNGSRLITTMLRDCRQQINVGKLTIYTNYLQQSLPVTINK